MIENAGLVFSSILNIFEKKAATSSALKTHCGKKVPPDGEIHMWGTSIGNMCCRITKHDNQSKIKAQQDAEKIRQAGGIPETEITRAVNVSRYPSHGIIIHQFFWNTQDRRLQEDAPKKTPHNSLS